MELPESTGCFMATSMTQPGLGGGTAPLKVDWSNRDREDVADASTLML